jgi:predicted enzyme related to lactoylglutathione lyase
MPSNNVVGWFEIYVNDMDRAKAFYEAVFQRQLQALPAMGQIEAMWAFPWVENAYGAPGALVKMPMKEAGAGGTIIYFSCADVSVESARAVAAGGQVALPRMAIGEYGFIALLIDTEGNMIGLHSMA